MLRIHQLTLTPDEALSYDEGMLKKLCAARLRIRPDRIAQVRLAKRSVDARKGDVHFSLTAEVIVAKGETADAALAKNFRPNEVTPVEGQHFPVEPDVTGLALPKWQGDRPVVVGAGPAGLFCALTLAARSANPILIERGQPVEKRTADLELLETEGKLNPESNVLFGEGGAGTFSDGKLTCGVNSPHIRTVLRTLAACGAPQEILIAAKPHIGTDELKKVLVQARKLLLSLGADIRFGTKLTGITAKDGQVQEALISTENGEERIPTRHIFLAIGHSARDTYRMLYDSGVVLQQKPFAAGVRIEHLQSEINRSQYGRLAGHPALPPAEYKLNVPTKDGRGVYTFCMCPGGRVINASSETGGINVNGMSLHARNGKNANSAVLVGVRPEDFGSDHPLAGMEWQRKIEQAAFALTCSMKAPCQRVEDFLQNRKTTAFGAVKPEYRPGVECFRLEEFLPEILWGNLRTALPQLGGRLHGFDSGDALLTGPETRSSAPVRILRGTDGQSVSLKGLYPIGEGAGYAGGIVSAAADGLSAAANCGISERE